MLINKLNGVGLLGKRKEPVEIGGRLQSNLVSRQATQFANGACGFLYERRLVALAAIRNRREVRAIGFNQHVVERHFSGRIADLLRLRKRDIPGKRDHESHVERSLGVRPCSRETMQNSPQSTRRPTFRYQL